MTKGILIVEDDKLQADELRLRLQKVYPQVEIYHLATELQVHELVKHKPVPFSVAVVDMMLRWTNPASDMKMPDPTILKEGFYTAGLRCCRLLSEAGVKCIIFTALDPERIPLRDGEHYPIINKSRGYDDVITIIANLR